MKNFAGKTAVITGGASGFGLEFAKQALARDMNVVIADIQTDALDKGLTELGAGDRVIGQVCDVAKAEHVQALANSAVDNFGGVHLLFNNAGVGSGGLIWENSQQDWEWVMGVNVWGVIHGMRIFTPIMLKQDEPGHIVNTASMAGLLNAQMMGVYNLTKNAVVSLSETLFHDLRITEAKIGCSVLCPAFVPTGISQSHRNRPAGLRNTATPTVSQIAAQQASQKAVGSGRLTAADVAAITYKAIEENQFYIYTHPKIMPSVGLRMEDIMQARNPSDPFTFKPEAARAPK
jgi:NAD(P)-dependent dehydrogenase (short-subunit alcohol dehydrogenase family)